MPTTQIGQGRDVFTVIFEADDLDENRQREALAVIEDILDGVVRQQPGFLCSHVHLSTDGKKLVNYQQWASAEAFSAFKEGPARDVMPRVAPFGISAKVYQVALSKWSQESGA